MDKCRKKTFIIYLILESLRNNCYLIVNMRAKVPKPNQEFEDDHEEDDYEEVNSEEEEKEEVVAELKRKLEELKEQNEKDWEKIKEKQEEKAELKRKLEEELEELKVGRARVKRRKRS